MRKRSTPDARRADDALQGIVGVYLHDACELLDAECARGVTGAALAHIGLSRDDLMRRDKQLSFDHYFGLLDWMYTERVLPTPGLQLGLRRRIDDLGVYGQAMRAGATVEQVLRMAERFLAVTWSHASLTWHVEGTVLVCRLERLPGATGTQEPFLQALTATTIAMTRAHVGPRALASLFEVRYGFVKPPDAAAYRRLLGCKVIFGAEHTEVRMPAVWLQLTSQAERTDVPVLSEAMALYRAELVAVSMAEQVSRAIELHRGERFPTLPQIARALGCSQRTLARRLAQEGTSFRQALDTFRMQLACRYLTQTALCIAEISTMLGYLHQPSFQRAFKACFGVTPHTMRKSSPVRMP